MTESKAKVTQSITFHKTYLVSFYGVMHYFKKQLVDSITEC